MSSSVRKRVASEHIEFFASYYLTHHVKSAIPQLHKTWYDLVIKNPRVAIAAPRGHAKSTIFSLVYPLWCILFQKKKFIILISDSISQAQELLGSIIEELETNERIIEDFGRIAGYIPPTSEEKRKWTASDIITLTGVKVIARGWKSKLRGLKFGSERPDLIIMDDAENDENVQSEDQRIKVRNMFFKSILNLGSIDTQVIVVGTILHFDSLLSNLLINPIYGWYTRLFRAIEDNHPIWPEWWTMDRLDEKRKEIGDISFEQEFMNNPLDPSTQIIKPKAYYDNLDLGRCDFYAYIDLAISEKETADYTAIVTIAKDRDDGRMYVLDPRRIRGDISKQMDLAFELFNIYPWRAFGVETVAYQKAFYQMLKLEMNKRGIYLPAIEVELDKDKVRRVLEITPYIDNEMVLFNNSYQEFNSECFQFPKGAHDDYVDAFTGAVKIAISYGGSGEVMTGGGVSYPTTY